jgi:hypothetical protein
VAGDDTRSEGLHSTAQQERVRVTGGALLPSQRSLRSIVGGSVLAAYAVGYLGLLLIGDRAVLVAIPGFVVTVLAGLVNAPRRQRWMGVPGAPFAWAPFRMGPVLFIVVAVLLGSFYVIDALAGGRGTPDIGGIGLLLPRTHYTFSTHGLQTEVERWRFVVVGLLFFTLWFAGGSFAAWVVFFRSAPSTPARNSER